MGHKSGQNVRKQDVLKVVGEGCGTCVRVMARMCVGDAGNTIQHGSYEAGILISALSVVEVSTYCKGDRDDP